MELVFSFPFERETVVVFHWRNLSDNSHNSIPAALVGKCLVFIYFTLIIHFYLWVCLAFCHMSPCEIRDTLQGRARQRQESRVYPRQGGNWNLPTHPNLFYPLPNPALKHRRSYHMVCHVICHVMLHTTTPDLRVCTTPLCCRL